LEEKRLVFVPDTNTWVGISDCVWAPKNLQFPGKQSIANSYDELQFFFTRVLGIKVPALELHVAALRKYGEEEVREPQVIKELIKAISALKPSSANLYTLSFSKVFFVRNTPMSKVNRSNTFIVDRKEYEDAFKNHIDQANLAVLDFSLKDVRMCRPFFEAMGLGSKFLSAIVKERTEVDGGQLNVEESLQMQWKAEAIMR
jgi:hypothetical protein